LWEKFESFKVQAKEAPEGCKLSLMGDSCGSSEDHNAVNKDYVNEVSERNKDSVGNLTTDHSCDILTKYLSTFCLS
jgi:hypothetical protein